jgi:Trypsin-like peptidase domain
MYKTTILFCLLFGILWSNAFSQTDFSTININGGTLYPYSVYINGKLVIDLTPKENLKVKYYSKGRTSIEFRYPSQKLLCVLDINEPKEYYVIGPNVLTEERWLKWTKKAESTVSIEEDINDPFGKIGDSKISRPAQGTCFALNPNGYLITNYHVVENAKEITVKGISGDFSTKYGVTVIASDRTNDLALLKITNSSVKFNNIPYSIRSTGVQQGEKAYAMGFPNAQVMGQEVKLTEGIISAKSGVEGDISKFQISAAVNPGNSGGPLIDEQGRLIGVVFAKLAAAEAAGYAVKSSYLQAFLSNVDGLESPILAGTIKNKPITEMVAEWKKFVFIVETN